MYLLTSKKVGGSLSKHLCSVRKINGIQLFVTEKNIYLFA